MFKLLLNALDQYRHRAEEDNVDLLYGLKVTGRTSWGLTDTVILRGPAAVDEEGNPAGPDEVEIKISSPTRMDLGSWFKEGVLYTLEFGSQGLDAGRAVGMTIPNMEVAEKTLWGLSTTSRLRTAVSQGKYVEVKVTLPWPEERLLKEGQTYAVIFEPLEGAPEEKVEDEKEEEPYREQGLEVLGEVSLDRLNEAFAYRPWEDDEELARIKSEAPASLQDRIDAALREAGMEPINEVQSCR